MRVVICGAGVIGAATAYFAATAGAEVTLVERDATAAAASGKSGGFLALDWCDGTALEPLARRSFELHAELAGALGADYGYRAMETFLVAGGAAAGRPAQGSRPDWLDGRASVHSVIGTPSTTAQVDPAAFTLALAEAARRAGARQVHGTVTGLLTEPDASSPGARRCRGVRLEGSTLEADAVVLAMGPWCEAARAWLDLPPVMASKGHSIVLEPARPIPAHALFVEYPVDARNRLSPEIFPRPNGLVYACGLPDSAALPEGPGDVHGSADAARALHAVCADLSSALGEARLVAHQACYRPIAADALPLMGPVSGVAGAFVATGHNCWGILNAPASGEAMAELVLEGHASRVDLAAYDLARPGLRDAAVAGYAGS